MCRWSFSGVNSFFSIGISVSSSLKFDIVQRYHKQRMLFEIVDTIPNRHGSRFEGLQQASSRSSSSLFLLMVVVVCEAAVVTENRFLFFAAAAVSL